MISRDEVMAALAAVPGPDGRASLPESGAVSGVTIRDGKVFVAIAIDPARAKAMEPMRAGAEAAIRAISGVAGAVVTLTAESARTVAGGPAAHGHQTDAPPRRHGRSSEPLPGVKHIIAVASGKGGVGKSTVACNLAVGLAKLGLAVGVLDADLFGPSMPRLFGIDAKPGLAPDGKKLVPLESCGVKIMSIGFLIEEGAPVIWRGPMVMSALNQLREVVWGELDVLVVDMPPGTGDTQLTMAQNVPLAGAVIVSTPQDLALIDARRGIAMFAQTKVPLIGVVENMSYFLCPHCGARTDVFSHGGARKEAEKLGVPFLGEVPLDIAIRAHSDDGRPVVASMPESPQANALLEIARRVAETLAVGAPGAKPAPRIRVL
jgi:ATP-binding protein involved in chromosome partitioning